MSIQGQMLPWGLELTGDEIRESTPNGFASKQHEAFHLYSRSVTLGDTESLSLPESIKGFVVFGNDTDGGVAQVDTDGTVVLISSTAGAGTAGSDNLQIADVTADDSTQIVNNSGSGFDLEVVLFYKDA